MMWEAFMPMYILHYYEKLTARCTKADGIHESEVDIYKLMLSRKF